MRVNIRGLFVFILFTGLFLMTLRPITDPDFWWHLRTGQLIFQTRAIPHADPFSFTNAGKPWIAHEWLSEIFVYGLYLLGHYALLIFVFSVIITGAFFLVYLRCPEPTRPYVAGFTLLLGAVATAPTWGVRPQMISLLLTSLFLFLLERYFKTNKLAYILPLPPLTLMWVNLHAGYFLGLVVMALFIIGGLLEILKAEFLKSDVIEPPPLKSLLVLCGVLMACGLATLGNPNGLQIITYPFQTLASPSMQQLIQEWFSPDFHLMEWQPLAWMILLLIGAGMLARKPISITNILLTLSLGYMGLRSMRNVPLFALAAIPVLADQLGSIIKIRSAAIPTPKKFLTWASPALSILVVLVVGGRFVQVVQGQTKAEEKNFPAAAVNWIVENKPERNLLNTYGWGGYLIWRLYPSYQVYIDGRADVYGDAFIFDYIKLQEADPGWKNQLDQEDIRTVLLEPGTPLVNILRLSPQWKIAFEDSLSVLFVRNNQ